MQQSVQLLDSFHAKPLNENIYQVTVFTVMWLLSLQSVVMYINYYISSVNILGYYKFQQEKIFDYHVRAASYILAISLCSSQAVASVWYLVVWKNRSDTNYTK